MPKTINSLCTLVCHTTLLDQGKAIMSHPLFGRVLKCLALDRRIWLERRKKVELDVGAQTHEETLNGNHLYVAL